MLHGAQTWLAARGIPPWTRPCPNQWIAARFAAGEFLVARRGAQVVAVVRVLRHDPHFWTDAAPDEALYIHSLAVARECAGQGIGAALLHWIGKQAKREGRSRLRLDCVATNPALGAYYARLGFAPRAEIAAGGERMMLFEQLLVP